MAASDTLGFAPGGRGLRQLGRAALPRSAREGALGLAQKSAAAGEQKNPIVLLSAKALSYSWKYLVPSFGLTLLYLNLHFLGRYFAHAQRLFSRFGYGLFGKPPKPPSVAAEYGEIIALMVLDAILAFLILIIVIFIAIMVAVVTRDCATLKGLGMIGWLASAAAGPLGVAMRGSCGL